MVSRWKWPTPTDNWVAAQFKLGEEATRNDRVARLKFLAAEFGPPTDMLLTGGFGSLLANHEMRWTFVEGHFLATVLVAQVFVEQLLGGRLILAGEDEAAEGGLSRIARRSCELGLLGTYVTDRVLELHRMRIAYGHAHVGLKSRSLMKRFLDQNGTDIWEFSEADARTALQIVVDLLRENSPAWNPDNPDFMAVIQAAYEGNVEDERHHPDQMELF